jgi:hypothetical protein
VAIKVKRIAAPAGKAAGERRIPTGFGSEHGFAAILMQSQSSE